MTYHSGVNIRICYYHRLMERSDGVKDQNFGGAERSGRSIDFEPCSQCDTYVCAFL